MKTKRLFQLALLAFLIFFAFLGWYGYRLSLCNCKAGVFIAGFSIIFAGWLILSGLHRYTKHPSLIISLFAVICFFGIWTYQPTVSDDSEPLAKLIAPLNNTLSLFLSSRGGTGNENDVRSTSSYQLLNLGAHFFFALFMFSIFGRRLINSSRRILFLRSKKNIFWGDSPGGILLAQDILDTERWQQPVFVFSHAVKDDTGKEKSLFEKIDSMGGIVLYRDFDNMRRHPRGHRHFFLTEDYDFNLKMALETARKNKKKITHIYLRTEMPRVDFLFRDYKELDLHILNQSGLTARQFVSDHPIIDLVPKENINQLTVDFHFNVLMLGFGSQGRELLNKTICDAQFKGSHFAATVIDKDFDRKRGEYQLLFEECISEYHLYFEKDEQICNIGSQHFYQWFKEHHRNFERIIIALDDDTLNLNISFALANLLIAEGEMNPQKRIFVHIAHADKHLYREYPVTMFGRLDEIYTFGVIVAEQMDRIAKAVNCVYSNYDKEVLPEINQNEAEKEWKKMSRNKNNSTFNKDSSRAVAMNVENIIKIAGGRKGFDELIKDPAMLEILAENEHLRWNAFLLTQGITRWNEITDDNPTEAKFFKYPNEKAWLLKHACLVPYKELDIISERVNELREKSGKTGKENFKETDRRIIRHFGLFWDELRPKVTPNQEIGV